MAVEKKDLLEFLGLKEEPENIDAFKEHFSKDFIARSSAADDPDVYKIVGEKTGRRLGQIETLFRQTAREKLGMEKIEGEKLEDIIPVVFELVKVEREKLKDQDKKTKDQKFQEIESDRDKYKSQYEIEKQGREAANKLLEEKDREFNSKLKTVTIEQQLGEVFKAVPFTDDYKNDPIRQKGFKQFLTEEAKFDLNDKGELVILKKDGTPFTNEAKNIHKTPTEVLAEFADKAKVKANNNLNNQRQQQNQQQQNNQNGGGNPPVHKYQKKS